MLHSCAEYLTHTLYRHCPLSEEKRPVFVYGFELSLCIANPAISRSPCEIFCRLTGNINDISRISTRKTTWRHKVKGANCGHIC